MSKRVGCIVVFEDEEGIRAVYGPDQNIPGGICCSDRVAFFSDSDEARRAIRISTLAAKLAKERGEIANDDFLGSCLKCIRVLQLEAMS